MFSMLIFKSVYMRIHIFRMSCCFHLHLVLQSSLPVGCPAQSHNYSHKQLIKGVVPWSWLAVLPAAPAQMPFRIMEAVLLVAYVILNQESGLENWFGDAPFRSKLCMLIWQQFPCINFDSIEHAFERHLPVMCDLTDRSATCLINYH